MQIHFSLNECIFLFSNLIIIFIYYSLFCFFDGLYPSTHPCALFDFPTNDRINSAPFLLPKSTFLVGSNALNFAFKVPNAFSTGASSGLYGAKNLTSNGSFSTHCFVSLDQWVGALSIRAIGISDVCKFSFLNKSSSSLRNMQNIFEFAVFL